MKKAFLQVTIVFLLVQSYVEPKAQNSQWVRTNYHNILFSPDLTFFPSETDLNGNSYLASITNYRLSYGSDYYGDFSVRKFDQTGSVIINRTFYGKVVIDGIQTDGNGNSYIFGSFMDTLTIDSSNKIYNTGSGFEVNYFLVKLSADGNHIWSKNINSIYGTNSRLDAVRVKNNRLYAGICNISNGFIRKFDLNGNELTSILQNPVRVISSIDADPSGNIIAGGACAQGNITFGNLVANAPFFYNVYVARYDATGNALWARFVEDITFQHIDLACDDAGNIYSAGDLFTDAMFGNIQAQGPQWVYDFFLTKIDPTGNFLWVREVPNTSGSITGDARKGAVKSMSIDHRGQICFTGMLRGTVDWGNGVITSSTGSHDVLLLKYDQNGNLLLGRKFGGISSDRGDAVSTDVSGNVFLSGRFAGTALFDTITVNGTGNLNSFLVKIPYGQSTGTINLSMAIEGFYDPVLNRMRAEDTASLYLRNATFPYSIVDSSKSLVDSEDLSGTFRFSNATGGQYYLQIKHRNSLETWSAGTVNYLQGGIIDYDLTSSASQAYGNNQIQVDNLPARFAIFSGDINQDGIVDAVDAGAVDNDAFNFVSGYVQTDVTGDEAVDAGDAAIVDNNAFNFVAKIVP